MMRFGLVCSSGGAVFEAAHQIMRNCGYDFNVAVVTDRECGAENICARLGIPFIRIEETDRGKFSTKAAQWLYDKHKVKLTVLFFSRLVGCELYSRAPCVNIHPSLLPAFPGFGALKAALNSGVKFFGATAHLVDQSTDGGSILAQVVAPLRHEDKLAALERVSFAQKLYLLLLICEWEMGQKLVLTKNLEQGEQCPIDTNYANPQLRNAVIEDAFRRFVDKEGIPWPK
jgi:phosphoribosylglycinamide formyltransferase-1